MGIEQPPDNDACFVFPDVESERGEIERVAESFNVENKDEFVERFIEQANRSELVELDEQAWSALENTDSLDVDPEGWDEVAHHAEEGKPDAPRNWQTLRNRLEAGESLGAPIVLKTGDRLHLVSGNTRLMVARAMGVTPRVLVVEMEHGENRNL